MMFFPRRVRLICFFIVTPWEIGVILTANYTFLNYLVLSLGFLLLDDEFLLRLVPAACGRPAGTDVVGAELHEEQPLSILDAGRPACNGDIDAQSMPAIAAQFSSISDFVVALRLAWPSRSVAHLDRLRHDGGDAPNPVCPTCRCHSSR